MRLVLLTDEVHLPATHLYSYHMEGNFGTAKTWQLTKNLPSFHHPNFSISITKSHVNIKQKEDIFLGMCPTFHRVPYDHLLYHRSLS